MILFWIFLLFLIIQRISELLLARRNEKIVKDRGAVEYDHNGYLAIVFMHIAFFISLICEKIFLGRCFNSLSIIFFMVYILAQFIRYWSIASLGVFWNTKVLAVPNIALVRDGPYRYFRHPNYMVVMTEIAFIPLIFSCYITAILFSSINFVLIRRRIRIEEDALKIA